MPRTFAPAKKDANHNEVVRMLRDCGYSVAETHAVGGVLDLFVAKQGITIAVEVKGPKGKLTEAEQKFWDGWRGLKIIARSGTDAVEQCEVILALWLPLSKQYIYQSGNTSEPIYYNHRYERNTYT